MATTDQRSDLQEKKEQLLSKLINATGSATELGKSLNHVPLVELCKVSLKAIAQFQNFLEEIQRPYILSKSKFDHWWGVLGRVILKFDDVLEETQVKTDPQSSLRKQAQKRFEKAALTLKSFQHWILTDPASFKVNVSDSSILDAVEPAEWDQQLADFKRTPKWMLKQICTLRGRILEERQKQKQKTQETVENLRNQWKSALKLIQEKDLQLKAKEQELQASAQEVSSQNERVITLHKSIIAEQAETISKLKQDLEEASANDSEAEQVRKLQLLQIKNNMNEKDKTVQNLLEKLKSAREEIDSLKKSDKAQAEKIKHLKKSVQKAEGKVRVATAQLRMTKNNEISLERELENEPETYDLQVKEVDTILEDLLDEHSISNEKNKISLFHEREIVPVQFSVAKQWLTTEHRRECLAQMVLDSSFDHAFLRLVERCQDSDLSDEFSKSILDIYGNQDRQLELIEAAIHIEVQRAQNVSELFRSEEFSARIVRLYLKTIGTPYARTLFADLINEIIDKRVHLELKRKTSKKFEILEENEAGLALSATALQEYVERFLYLILNSTFQIPQNFLIVLQHILKRTKKKFPLSKKEVLCNVILLRFFCPFLASLEGVRSDPIPIEIMATFTLISKCLQCFCFDKIPKSGYDENPIFSVMSTIVSKSGALWDDYLNQVSEWPRPVWGNSNAMIKVDSLISKEKQKILAAIQVHDEKLRLVERNWIQEIRIRPIDTLVSILQLFKMERKRSSVQKKDLEGSQMLNRFYDKRISNSSFPTNRDDPAVLALKKMCFETEAIFVAILKAAFQHKTSRFPLSALFVVCEANNYLHLLAKRLIQTEIAFNFSDEFLHQSYCRDFFIWFCKKNIHTWLQPHWGRVLSTIITENLRLDVDPITAPEGTDLPGNLRKLKNTFYWLIDSASNNLESCPSAIWEFSRILANYTSQDLLCFFFLNLFAEIMKDPVGFQIVPKMEVQDGAALTLRLLQNLMESVGNDKEFCVAMEDFDRIKYDEAFSNWLLNPRNQITTPTSPTTRNITISPSLSRLIVNNTSVVSSKSSRELKASSSKRSSIHNSASSSPSRLSRESSPSTPGQISWKEEKDELVSVLNFILFNLHLIEDNLSSCGSIQQAVQFSTGEILSDS